MASVCLGKHWKWSDSSRNAKKKIFTFVGGCTTLHLSADFGTARYPHLADTCILLYRPVSSTHKHSKNNYCCDECGIVKDTVKKLQDHQHSHKTGICYKCAKTISCQNMPKHLKICKGVREKEMGKV